MNHKYLEVCERCGSRNVDRDKEDTFEYVAADAIEYEIETTHDTL